MEAQGYQVVFQGWDFRPGSDFVQQMDEVVEEAQRTIAVLSPAYLVSAFGRAEWGAVFAKDPTGERGLLLPVRVEEVDPPGLLRTRVYVDLVGKDAATAQSALLAAAQGARGKPTKEPRFPSGSATEAPRFPGELPPIWNVPYHPNPYFTGRDLLLAEVHARLTKPEADRRRVVLTGLGGMGKTQIVVEHAYRQRADYDLVWWVRSEQPTSLLGDYAALARQAPLVADLLLAETISQEAAAAAVRAWLEQERHRRWLLVFDNVAAPAAVVEVLPRGGTGQVLLTTQAETGWEPLADALPVEVLAPTDAAGFLLSRTKQQGPEVMAAATTLASALDGLPLALEQAAAYIVAAGTVSLTGYVELFTSRELELLKRGQPLGYQQTVATTWSLALQRLQDTQPAAVGLLTLAAFLASDDLPLSLLTAHAEVLSEPLAATAADPLALGDSVAALRGFSLLRVVADGLFVHRLVQAVVRGALDPKDERAWAVRAIQLLRAGFPPDSGVADNWPECERLLPHVLAVADYAQRLEVESQAWLWLLKRAGTYLWRRGQYRQALTVDEKTLAASQRVLGDDHPDTLTSMYNLADTYRHLNRLDEALQLHQQTLDARRRVLSPDDSDTLKSMDNLAETRRALGELDAARDLHEQTLTARQHVLRDDHPDTLRSINNLGMTLADLRDLHGAQDLLEQAVAGRRRVLGDDHPDTLRSISNLAQVRRELGEA